MSETRICSRCRETKPTTEFYWKARKPPRKSCWGSWCKVCESARRVSKNPRPVAQPPEKLCSRCNTVKPIEKFHRRRGRSGEWGRTSDCAACRVKRCTELRKTPEGAQKHRERVKEYRRRILLKSRGLILDRKDPALLDAVRRAMVEAPPSLDTEEKRVAYFIGFVAGAKRSGYESERFEKLKDLCHRIASEMSKWGKAGHFQSYEDNLGVAYEGLLAFIRKRKEYESDEHERRTAAMAIRNAIRDYARLEGPIKRAGNARYEQTIIPTDGDGEPVVVQASPDELWRDDGLRDSLDQLDLDPRSRAILEGLAAGVTYRELGERFGITESRACQIGAQIRERYGERLLAALS